MADRERRPIVSNELWRTLDGPDQSLPRPPADVWTVARRARQRRLAVVLGAISLAFFVLVVALLVSDTWDGTTPCGSPLGRTDAGFGCDDVMATRWRWVVALSMSSLSAAALAFRWRWGANWSEVRLDDGRAD